MGSIELEHIYRHFDWITDCSGLQQCWEMDLMPKHQGQRWKIDMMRYDLTAHHRPECMLCECNLLSRHNSHATKLRIEEKKEALERNQRIEERTQQGMSPNKGVRKLAAATRRLVPSSRGLFKSFHTLLDDFKDRLRSYDHVPGLSNVAPVCEGTTVARTWLASICDQDRFMGSVTYTGFNLIEEAKKESCMRSKMVFTAASNRLWVKDANEIGPEKLARSIVSRAEQCEADWAWIDIGIIPRGSTLLHQRLITALKTNGCGVALLHWCKAKAPTNDITKQWTDWCATTHPDWIASKHKMQNVSCGGPIRCTAHLAMLAPLAVSNKIGPFDDIELGDPMETHLDDANMRHSDYLSGWSMKKTICPHEQQDRPVGKMVTEWENEDWMVFASSGVAPDIVRQADETEDHHFLIEASDSGVRHAVRPVRDSELLRMHGFSEQFQREALRLDTRQRKQLFQTATPKHSVAHIVSVLQVAELARKQSEMECHGRDAGELCQQKDPTTHHHSAREEGEAIFSCATAKIINRWTTFPLPTLKEWQEASANDSDIACLIDWHRQQEESSPCEVAQSEVSSNVVERTTPHQGRDVASVGASERNPHPTVTTTGGAYKFTTAHTCGTPCLSCGRTRGVLQDPLEDCGSMLLAYDV